MSLTRWPQTRQLLGAVVILALLPAGSVIAQEMVLPEPLVQEHTLTLREGTWGGTMTPPGGETEEITYAVKTVDGELAITLESRLFGTVPATEIRLWHLDGKGSSEMAIIQFSWTHGPTMDCTLWLHEAGSYEGECKDPSGESGYLTMVPPQGG